MGVMDRFRAGETKVTAMGNIDTQSNMQNSAVGFDDMREQRISLYDNDSINEYGYLSGFNYDDILRDKQKHMYSLFRLADYYVDTDPIFRGIIKGVYTPFSIANGYRLVGTSDRIKKKYQNYYDQINLEDKLRSMFYQYYKYGNVYVYLKDDGNIITLPVTKVKIGNVAVNGEPILYFNVQDLKAELRIPELASGQELARFINDNGIFEQLQGLPSEIAAAVAGNKTWVQLDPKRTFVLQGIKEDWRRYSVPLIATCLPAFAKKELISNYEAALLNAGMRPFVHVKYGDPEGKILVDKRMLAQADGIFRRAIQGGMLATTNHWATATYIQADTSDMFADDKYKEVNAEILSAGGVSGIIVSGRAEDGSNFASAQVSMQTAAMRIKEGQHDVAYMMNKINKRVNELILPRSSQNNIPEFEFPPIDLSGDKQFQEKGMQLWQGGMISSRTLLELHGYDLDQEAARKKDEKENGIDEIMTPPNTTTTTTEVIDVERDEGGRPALELNDRTSDESNSMTGKQPKPSNPEGSL